jgi:hypothetical protein
MLRFGVRTISLQLVNFATNPTGLKAEHRDLRPGKPGRRVLPEKNKFNDPLSPVLT